MTRRRQTGAEGPEATPESQLSGYPTEWVLALLGTLLLFLSFPPAGWSALAWFAPVPWLLMVRRPVWKSRRPFLVTWAAGFIFWMAMLQGVRLAHPANYLGWMILSGYLALYLPAFVFLCRFAQLHWRFPLWLMAPVIWTGLELLRGYVVTGFSLALLAHSQFQQPAVLQLAALGGAYAVSFLMVLVAACIACCLPVNGRGWNSRPLAIAAVAWLGALAYGTSRLSFPPSPTDRELRVVLIQSNFETRFEFDPQRNNAMFDRYWRLTLDAIEEHTPDLVVWPESAFTENAPEVLLRNPSLRAGLPRERLEEMAAAFRQKRSYVLERIRTDRLGRPRDVEMLIGTETHLFQGTEEHLYNAALLLGDTTETTARYHKMHPVMFGEYFPLGGVFPWIYQIAPMSRGLTPGAGAKVFEVKGVRLSPSICFESTVPHLIQQQVADLIRRGQSPDVLVNLTHDGWFFGTSILDHQLACAVMRAVETGRPVLVAANAGFSAWIDPRGRIVERGPRAGDAKLRVELQVPQSPMDTWFLTWGDYPAWICAMVCLMLGVRSGLDRFRSGRWKAGTGPQSG